MYERRGKVIRSRILKWYCVWVETVHVRMSEQGCTDKTGSLLDGAAARANVDEITASELTTGEWHHFFIDQWRLTLSGTASRRRVDLTPPQRTHHVSCSMDWATNVSQLFPRLLLSSGFQWGDYWNFAIPQFCSPNGSYQSSLVCFGIETPNWYIR